MKIKVHKETIPYSYFGERVILKEEGLKVLSAMNQKEDLVIYYEVNPTTLIEQSLQVISLMTGQECNIPDDFKFVNTVSFDSGSFIVHVYANKVKE